MSAALGLLRLQQVDSRISRIEGRLAKIREALENDAELQAMLREVETAQVEEQNAERARRKSEAEAQGQQVKIQQAESSLYGGKVHNPKELQGLQADVASLKKHLSTLEEQELEAMLELETAQTALKNAREKLQSIRARLGGEHQKLVEEQESLSRDLEQMQTERQAATNALTADVLKAYDDLRQQRGGVAVVEVSENACGACGTTLTDALEQSARHALQLVHCPSCGRILYAG